MLVLRTLGTFGVDRDGVPIEALAAHRRAMAILAILGAGGATTRDRVMALLWPDSDIERARGSLKQAVHLLRRHLGPDDFLGGRAELALDPNVIVADVRRFRDALAQRSWGEAVACYGGPFLDGVHLDGSPEFDEWAETTRQTLGRDFREALERLALDAEAARELDVAISWWRKRQLLDPWDGRVALKLMQALIAAGQRGGALQHALAYENALRAHLGLAPDAAVAAYVAELRQGVTARERLPSGPAEVAGPTSTDVPSDNATIMSTSPRSPVRRFALGLVAAVLLVGSIGYSWWGRGAADTASFDRDLVAVASFGVVDPTLSLWREGLGDILAQDLDGAGPLRTLAPAVALRRGAVTDRASAERFGERTGAGVVVYGSVLRKGTDSVQIRASLFDRDHDASDQIEVSGLEVRIGELADSVGVRLLRLLGERRAIASVRHVSIGSRSLPALKSFLRGEQLYRLGESDSALYQFDLAVRADSTFALAMRRMVWLLGTFAPTSDRYGPRLDYLRRAMRMNHGLSPRDSALLVADSTYHLTPESPTPDGLIGGLFAVVENLERLAHRYPDDPAVWYDLAELRTHLVAPLGDPATALATFDRAIALDSGFAPAYMHTVALSLELRDVNRATGYAHRYLAMHTPNRASEVAPAIHLLMAILDSSDHAPRYVERLVTEASAGTLHWVGTDHLKWWTDSAETAVVLLRALSKNGDPAGTGLVADTLMTAQALARALAYRGHLAEAARVNRTLFNDASASLYVHRYDVFAELAMLGIIDTATAGRTFARALDTSDWSGGNVHLPPRKLRGVSWWFARGDSASLDRMSRRGAEVARTARQPLEVLRGRYFGGAAQAYLTLLRGDSTAAMRQFGALSDSLCMVAECGVEKLALARLLAASGDSRGALALYARWARAGAPGPHAVLASLEHARMAERVGDQGAAALQYRFVLEAWRTPDPILMPYVNEARAGLRRVAAKMKG